MVESCERMFKDMTRPVLASISGIVGLLTGSSFRPCCTFQKSVSATLVMSPWIVRAFLYCLIRLRTSGKCTTSASTTSRNIFVRASTHRRVEQKTRTQYYDLVPLLALSRSSKNKLFCVVEMRLPPGVSSLVSSPECNCLVEIFHGTDILRTRRCYRGDNFTQHRCGLYQKDLNIAGNSV